LGAWGYNFNAKSLRPESFTQAARWGDWKAIRPKANAPLELYNLRTDGSESRNMASTETDVVARMEKFLKAAHATPRPHAGGTQNWVT
jgi:hypothetical protein